MNCRVQDSGQKRRVFLGPPMWVFESRVARAQGLTWPCISTILPTCKKHTCILTCMYGVQYRLLGAQVSRVQDDAMPARLLCQKEKRVLGLGLWLLKPLLYSVRSSIRHIYPARLSHPSSLSDPICCGAGLIRRIEPEPVYLLRIAGSIKGVRLSHASWAFVLARLGTSRQLLGRYGVHRSISSRNGTDRAARLHVPFDASDPGKWAPNWLKLPRGSPEFLVLPRPRVCD